LGQNFDLAFKADDLREHLVELKVFLLAGKRESGAVERGRSLISLVWPGSAPRRPPTFSCIAVCVC
jgi:hypothetical protein